MNHCWVEVSLPRLKRNLAAVRRRIGPSVDVMAVVKANAYGHGAGPISRALRAANITRFAVATLEEGLELRQVVPDAQILVLTGCAPGQAQLFRGHDLTAAVFDLGPVESNIKIELKIDTGMTRLGVPWERAAECIARLGDQLCGVYSHFAAAESDSAFTQLQLDRFLAVTSGVRCRRHICNSAALRFPAAWLDAVRPGLALYGISPCAEIADLEPVLCWKTRVLTLREVPADCPIGYGLSYVTQRPSRIGVLAVGYADGFSRTFSNRGMVRIRGRLVPVVGRVSMDLTTVDLTEVPEAVPGDIATLLEDDPHSPISAPALARAAGSIPYEILTSIGPRVSRVYES